MKTIQNNTQKAQHFANMYKWAQRKGYYHLEDLYKSYSNAKYNAFNRCWDDMIKNAGHDHVVWGNLMTFSFAYLKGPDLIVITPQNKYIILDYNI